MNILIVVLIASLVAIAGAVYLAYERAKDARVTRDVEREQAELKAATSAAEARDQETARQQRLLDDPQDHIRSRTTQDAPAMHALDRRVDEQRRGVATARAGLVSTLGGFRDNVAPTPRQAAFILALASAWIIVFVSYALLEIPVLTALSGGNLVQGLLAVAAILAVPFVTSLLFFWLVDRRREGMAALPFAIAAGGLLAVFLTVTVYLVQLAPARIELELADEVRTAQGALDRAREDGDVVGEGIAQSELDALATEQKRAAAVAQSLVAITAGVEFATSPALLTAIALVRLRGARSAAQEAKQALAQAIDDRQAHRMRRHAEISRELGDAGVLQIDVVRAGLAITNPVASALPPAPTVPAEPAPPQGLPVAGPSRPATASRPPGPPRVATARPPASTEIEPEASTQTMPNHIPSPDPSFDLS